MGIIVEGFDVAILIPARLASTRFPSKALADIHGKPMIQWVYERCSSWNRYDVYVATEDDEIVRVVHGFGGKAINTGKAPTVLHRCSLAAGNEIVNSHEMLMVVQGDEPMVSQLTINKALSMLGTEDLNCCYTKLEEDADPDNRNIVKAVLKKNGQEFGWFSRAPIPLASPEGDYGSFRPQRYKQVSVMTFRTDVLARYRFMPIREAEMVEGIDLLRYLEHGYSIGAVPSALPSYSVDVPDDLEIVKRLILDAPA